jgi:putative superfamily III holin-X
MAVSARSTANGQYGDLRDRGTGELIKQLSNQVSTLVRQEAELAKAEAAEKGKKAGAGAGMFGGAGVAGLLTLGSLTAFLILVLALAIPAWASALLVTALWAAVAAVLALQGRNKLRDMGMPIPEKTVETVKEDVQWLKNRR